MNKKLDEGVKYIKLIFGELIEHKDVLTEHKDMFKDILTEHKKILVNIDSRIGDVKFEMSELNKNMCELIDIIKNK